MAKPKKIKDNTEDSSVYKKALRFEFDCSYCPPNRVENSGGHRIPKPDKYKTKKRSSIRNKAQ